MNGLRLVIDGNKLEYYVNSFVDTTFILGGKRTRIEMPSLRALFQYDVISMFWYWYVDQTGASGIVMDGDHVPGLFEEVLRSKNVKFKCLPWRGRQDLYQYKFSRLRLTKLGVKIYFKL